MKKKNKNNLKAILKEKLTSKELPSLIRGFDIIGNIAIIEIPRELTKKQRLIGNTLLQLHKNLSSVFKKGTAYSGKFRTRKLIWLAGQKSKETLYKENNIRLKLDVEKVYFSPRLANDRLRVAKQVLRGERILILFSGCGPYTFTLSKNTQAKEIYAIELNPVAHKYALENQKLNKSNNTVIIHGDAKKELEKIISKNKKNNPKNQLKFDRILVPLPKCAEDFLDVALKVTRKDAIIHFYDFQKENEFELSADKIKKACKTAKKKCKILAIVKCGQNAPRTYRICADFRVL
ncbi:tRNA (guanine-N1)-methyltransferase [Candidatus Woesearchaeota archaeon]|nr:tRNA (guanine-N1)-methyltransferase [Candidatus Woesearchaeota archaeon]